MSHYVSIALVRPRPPESAIHRKWLEARQYMRKKHFGHVFEPRELSTWQQWHMPLFMVYLALRGTTEGRAGNADANSAQGGGFDSSGLVN